MAGNALDSAVSDGSVIRFIDSLWLERGLSDNTLSAYRRDLQRFEQWCLASRNLPLSAVQAADLQHYLGERLRGGQAPRSAARFLSSVALFLSLATARGRYQRRSFSAS